MNDYILHQSKFIESNISDILIDIDVALTTFNNLFPNADSTWTYNKYNVFTLTSPSTNFYKIYQELRNYIRNYLGEERPLWIQSWINFMKFEELNRLDWHGHDFEYHGYISIDPKNTNTEFDNYTIKNKPGQIYLGPGHRKHRVVAVEPFDGVRVTLGFDIVALPNTKYVTYYERPWMNKSFIPLL